MILLWIQCINRLYQIGVTGEGLEGRGIIGA